MTLGKRKDRDDEEKEKSTVHGSTLFVSNLPYTATSVDLQTLFSDIAPVRSAFVITEHGTGVSKGIGYVSFSIKDDAESAYHKILNEGIVLNDRKLRVDWADRKSKSKSNEIKKELKPRPNPHTPVQKTPRDRAAIRTIIISGLPQSLDSKQLWKKIRKYEGVEKVDWPFKSEDGTEDSSIAHVLFSTPAAANNAITRLHAHVFKGSLLSVTLKRRLENLTKPVPASDISDSNSKMKNSTTITGGLAPSHANRLIVRNLPWNTTEQDIRVVFLPYGPIYRIDVPTAEVKVESGERSANASSISKPRVKGFAFVWMLSKKDAERAIEGCNGKVVRAGTAQELISDKQKKKKQKRLEEKMKEAEKVKEVDVVEGMEKKGHDGEYVKEVEKVYERAIAVDWALSKDRWEQAKARIEQQAEGDQDEDIGSDGETDDNSVADLQIGIHSGDDNDSTPSEDEEEDDREEPVKPSLPTTDVGTTLFIRNVPFAATEDELRILFRAFGPLRYARIVTDPETGRSRGTGFACFWNKEDTDKVVEQSDLLRKETTGDIPVPAKKNPFVLPSILTPDPSSSLAQSLVLHGRTLDVVRAVTRDQASKLKEEGEKARQKADKRNMYLLKEGATPVILPNSPLSQNITPADLERRTNSYNARRALLKSNPLLYISQTRLSIRQIPLFVTERVLKRLALHAVHTFEAEVKEGSRTGLTPDELARPNEDETNPASHTSTTRHKRFTGHSTGVKQTKIVRQQDRVDVIIGKGRSKGYGFVEMRNHPDALRVLRWANCNPNIGPLLEQWYKEEMEDLLRTEKQKAEKERDETRMNRMQEEIDQGPRKNGRSSLIVEFSIENVQVVQRRGRKQDEVAIAKASGVVETRKRKSISPVKKGNEMQDSPSPMKKRKVSKGDDATVETDEKLKIEQSIGSIIGRKRKERKKHTKGS